jgi:hypothetical protein
VNDKIRLRDIIFARTFYYEAKVEFLSCLSMNQKIEANKHENLMMKIFSSLYLTKKEFLVDSSTKNQKRKRYVQTSNIKYQKQKKTKTKRKN